MEEGLRVDEEFLCRRTSRMERRAGSFSSAFTLGSGDASDYVQEADLVRESLYALQGIPAAVRRLEQLAEVYLSTEADKRALRAAGTIWSRTASSKAVGKLLQEFAEAGRVRCCLDLFANFFLEEKLAFHTGTDGTHGGARHAYHGLSDSERKQLKELQRKRWAAYRQVKLASCGLVNQAFAKAVKSIALGHSAALGTLVDSVCYRRLRSLNQGFDPRFKKGKDGPVSDGPIGLRDVTLLELFLHTKDLRSHLHALAAICFFQRGSDPRWTSDFLSCAPSFLETANGRTRSIEESALIFSQWHDFLLVVQGFPRGADLLSYLHSRLLDADSRQAELLRFLFARAWGPYSVFIRSWLYHATVTDPYAEFIVEPSPSLHKLESVQDYEQTTVMDSKVRAGVSVPSFLKQVCNPLVLAGQQLQVLLRLPETREFARQIPGYMSLVDSTDEVRDMPESFWGEKSSMFSALLFNKQMLDESLQLRHERSHGMTKHFMELFEVLMSKDQSGQKDPEEINTEQLMVESSADDDFHESVRDFQFEHPSHQDETFSIESLSLHSVSTFMGSEQILESGLEDLGVLSVNRVTSNTFEIDSNGDEIAVPRGSGSDSFVTAVRTPTDQSEVQSIQLESQIAGDESEGEELPSEVAPESVTSGVSGSVQAIDKVGSSHRNNLPVWLKGLQHAGLKEAGGLQLLSQEISRKERDDCINKWTLMNCDGRADSYTNSVVIRNAFGRTPECKIGMEARSLRPSSRASGTDISDNGNLVPFYSHPESLLGSNDLRDLGEVSVQWCQMTSYRENQNTESFLSDYLKAIWPIDELPGNPFLLCRPANISEFYSYSPISFPESEDSWDIGAKIVDSEAYSGRYFDHIPKDPLRRRRVLAELPLGNPSEFLFLHKHLSHSQGKAVWPSSFDLGSNKKGSDKNGSQIEQQGSLISDEFVRDLQTNQARHQSTVSEIPSKAAGLARFECLNTHIERALKSKNSGQFGRSQIVGTGLDRSGLTQCQGHTENTSIRWDLRKVSVQLTSACWQELQEPIVPTNDKGLEEQHLNDNDLQGLSGQLPIVKCVNDIPGDAASLGSGTSQMVVTTSQADGGTRTGDGILIQEISIGQHPTRVREESERGSWEERSVIPKDDKGAVENHENQRGNVGVDGEIPFTVVVEKSIVEEITLQYQCVSLFTVKVLLEGLHLLDHYAALRRYFFLEKADWADNFVSALSEHKWSSLGGRSKLLAVQRMLEGSLQRSSCEGDEFAERLYICSVDAAEDTNIRNWAHTTSTVFASERLQTFDSINMGYRVDWPLTLVLTPDSLKEYGSVFSFLIRIKSTTHTLSNIWESLKVIGHDHRDGIAKHQHQRDCFRMLQLFRWQVCHFVTSLQQYLESKLLYVVWSKFQQAAEYEGKDIYDLEALHRSYLEEATNCCFLSKSMAVVMSSVNKILQSVFDFQIYLRIAITSMDDNVLSDHLYRQACQLNTTFQQSLRHLDSCRYKPEYRSLLVDFWMYLDHSGFLANACSQSKPPAGTNVPNVALLTPL